MTAPHVMEMSRAIPVETDAAFRRTLSIPLPTLFNYWYGPIAPVRAVLGQSGEWGTVGQTRTVVQVGGGSMREELVGVDPPNVFSYILSDVAGPLAPVVERIDGAWRFEPLGTGTRVTWHWSVYPKSSLAGSAMPLFARIWRGHARRALERLSDELVG